MKIIGSLLLLLIIGCATHSEPDWFGSQPKTNGYWFGIGMVEKPFQGGECREKAINLALSEISSQISVEISASFERIVTENNLSFEDFSQSIIKTRVEKNLPNVEYVDYYDSKEKCGMLARLSQSIYYETIALQRRNAIQTSIGLLEQAESNFSFQTFSYLNEAMSEIMPYLDIPIEEEYPIGSGNRVNLHRYIKVLASQSMSRLSLDPNQKDLEVKRGFTRDIQLGMRVKDKINDTPMESIPVMCYMVDDRDHALSLSDSDGGCIFSLPQIREKKSIQYVNYKVDQNGLINNLEMFGNLSNVQVQTILKVISPQIHVKIIEKNLDNITDNPYVQPVFSEFFSHHYSANFTEKDNADLLINGVVNTRSLSDTPNEYGIYQVFGDLTISISNGISGEEIMSKSYNQIQGSDFNSNREAANQSLKKMSIKITEDFLPEILNVIEGL